MQKIRHRAEQGFTIVELLIATSVFAIILLLVTYGILQIGRTYSKGVTETKTQQTASDVMDAITQDIQFDSSGAVLAAPSSGGNYVICIGNDRYTILTGKELIEPPAVPNVAQDQSNYAVLVDTDLVGGCSTGTPQSLPPPPNQPTKPVELLAPFMRVATISVTPQAGNLYTVEVKVVYGADGDLNSSHDGCQSGTTNQYCAVSDLTSTVEKRIN